MSERVTMPALGESVTEGTVTRWLKNVGDTVAVDEPLLEVSTDKVDTEIPSPVAGVLQEILAGEDDTVPVGADLAVIGDGSSEGGSDAGSQDAGQQESGQQEQAQEAPAAEAPSTAQEPQPATSEPEQQQAEQPQQSGGDQGGQQSGGSGGGETVTMPALGESVTEGTVTRWLKAEGDTVEVDEPLLEVSTDKVDTEIPSPVAGVVTKILVQEDDTVPVGGELAVIGGSGGGAGEQAAPQQEQPAQQSAPQQEAPQQQPAQPQQEQAPAQAQADTAQAAAETAANQPAGSSPAEQAERTEAPAPAQAPAPSQAPAQATSGEAADASAYVTPLVRKLAAENNVDLASIKGTGVGGRVRKQDVLDAAKAAQEAAAAPAPAPAAAPAAAAPTAAPSAPSTTGSVSPKRGTTEKMSRLRQTIAKRMVESLQVSAQLTTVVEVDVTKIARLRARAKADFERREGTKLSFLPFFALAAVEALKEYPQVNSSVEGDQITYHGQENLGVAVDTERGLLVPVIKNAGDLNIAGLARGIADLADRTRNNKIMPDELSGGTFTLTNTGSRGALFDTPIINQPNVGILGTGAVVKRPVVVTDADGGETIAVRSMVYLALSYDHRVVDGADAARFLSTMKSRLEEGNFEV
ncbi:2-oxoglutarate dehydrogenase, E2 component, dihydrolipoamide succinyltransferase [Phycicoccus sp. M110.8]|uniref:2-oxoglutarate dehydrogenase, E2 component, dihydrolipoamide succinyltransferase n=1 Tax=Phycicoccus sp. M110.8 TaxID=3075433 RepID=UPI0028FD7375|nr:2-oxoglutarate dehydrogenase, E2 component, dihydrolipoamide succinyltransferase [Phycicoccus sp. M110.8]MDU0315106.1 2-oxoglutarate dehydrogenase, E2 component, dihydrolipoamide succinyltransferase [Phycicoccus sp. M110.8]